MWKLVGHIPIAGRNRLYIHTIQSHSVEEMYFSYMKTVAMALAVIVTTVRSAEEDERSRDLLTESLPNYALDVTPFQSFQTKGFLRCAWICLRFSLCFYFNYQNSLVHGLCEVFKGLHFHRRSQLATLLIPKTGFTFAEVISKVRTY